MFCSTIIPTVGRSSLAHTVQSVLEQNFTEDNFEIIVVNDSGKLLPPANWQQCEKVRVLNTNGRERCVARNTGAAIAHGRFLHFLDDDDWLHSDAFKHFWDLAHKAKTASWLYGATQLVDRENNPIIKLEYDLQGNCFTQVMAGEWLPLQSSLIETKAFFAVGGFNPVIPGAEDIDLARRIALKGDIRGTSAVVSTVGMGQENSTTNYSRALLLGRWAREDILHERQAFDRMRQSAPTPYWQGRMTRTYLSSAIWNLSNQRFYTALSRLYFGLISLVIGSHYFLSKDFWKAISHSHEGEAFVKGFQKANRPIERR